MECLERKPHNWTLTWNRKFEEYLGGQPRAGIFIDRLLEGKFNSVLEIACGSARDSLYLQDAGKEVTASDSNHTVISRLQSRFPNLSNIEFRIENAHFLSFPDHCFDVSFHNGFYIYFDDDLKIQHMLREQCRVTKKHVLFFVHNAHNNNLRRKFHRESLSDSLYDIRFFSLNNIQSIVSKSGANFTRMHIHKFGGPADRFLHHRIRGLSNPLRYFTHRHLSFCYAMTPLKAAERLVCHLEL